MRYLQNVLVSARKKRNSSESLILNSELKLLPNLSSEFSVVSEDKKREVVVFCVDFFYR